MRRWCGNYDCLHCELPECKYDDEPDETEVAKAIKAVVVHPKRGRPRNHAIDPNPTPKKRGRPKRYSEGTYWENYSRENRQKLNQKSRERYYRKKEEKMLTNRERVRALLGNLKNWSWDVEPQFRVEKEDSDALRAYVKYLEDKVAENAKTE